MKRTLTPSVATLQFLEGPSAWTLVINGHILRGSFKTEGEALAWAEARGYEVVR